MSHSGLICLSSICSANEGQKEVQIRTGVSHRSINPSIDGGVAVTETSLYQKVGSSGEAYRLPTALSVQEV